MGAHPARVPVMGMVSGPSPNVEGMGGWEGTVPALPQVPVASRAVSCPACCQQRDLGKGFLCGEGAEGAVGCLLWAVGLGGARVRLCLLVFPPFPRPGVHQPTPPEADLAAVPRPGCDVRPRGRGCSQTPHAMALRGRGLGGYPPSEHLPPPCHCAPGRGVRLPSRSPCAPRALPRGFATRPILLGPSAGFNAPCVPPPRAGGSGAAAGASAEPPLWP